MKRNRVISTVLLVIFLFSFMTPVSVFAADGKKGRITIECKYAGMHWNIFRVADANDDGTLSPTEEFSKYRIPSFLNFREEVQSLAYTFESYIRLEKSVPVASGKADMYGKVVFSDLEEGWYTAVAGKMISGNTVYTASPIMVCITSHGLYSEVWGTDVKISPKISERKTDPKKDIVIKFQPDPSKPLPDKPVVIIIYRDNEEYDRIILERDDDWTYVLPDMPDDDSDWSVIQEDAPEDVYPLYHKESSRTDDLTIDLLIIWHVKDPDNPVTDTDFTETITVTDTDIDKVTDTNTDTQITTPEHPKGTTVSNFTEVSDSPNETVTTVTVSESSLPQTGQLWWPVPVLSSAGIIFIAAGIIVRRKRGE